MAGKVVAALLQNEILMCIISLVFKLPPLVLKCEPVAKYKYHLGFTVLYVQKLTGNAKQKCDAEKSSSINCSV